MTVPTVLRLERLDDLCVMPTAGGRPVILSAAGRSEPLEKLARVGGEGFDVAALAFGVERVEREAGFAAAAEPAEDDQLAVGDVEIDPLEVMHLDAAQRNAALGHCCRSQLPSDTTTQPVMIARRNTMGQLWRPQVVSSYGF